MVFDRKTGCFRETWLVLAMDRVYCICGHVDCFGVLYILNTIINKVDSVFSGIILRYNFKECVSAWGNMPIVIMNLI